jgi:hypothetical protein
MNTITHFHHPTTSQLRCNIYIMQYQNTTIFDTIVKYYKNSISKLGLCAKSEYFHIAFNVVRFILHIHIKVEYCIIRIDCTTINQDILQYP